LLEGRTPMLHELDGMVCEESMITLASPAKPVLELARATREEALQRLDKSKDLNFSGVDLSMLQGELDPELAEHILNFCGRLPKGDVALRLAHNDLGSGTDCEQRIFDLTAERKVREMERAFYVKKKADSSTQKDFASAAQMRRKGEEGIAEADARLKAIDDELNELELRKIETPWYALFSKLEARPLNGVRHLDLSNCGLHATGLVLLSEALLELEHRAEGEKISWLSLDGNDLGDIGMGAIASFIRMTGAIEAIQLRNVGITARGVSELVAGLVTNKSLSLLDLRSNGLCSLEAAEAAVTGVRRFNHRAEILLA